MADSLNSLTPQSSLDFSGLGTLRGHAQKGADKATRETATQFEAMFIHEMLKSMRQTIEKNDLTGSDAEDTFQEMYDRELSQQLAKRNTLGVADMLVKHIERQQGTPPAKFGPAEPMPLKTTAEALSLERTQAPMKLQRPEKFRLNPSRVGPVTGQGADE